MSLRKIILQQSVVSKILALAQICNLCRCGLAWMVNLLGREIRGDKDTSVDARTNNVDTRINNVDAWINNVDAWINNARSNITACKNQ